jgi:hypothetical protein
MFVVDVVCFFIGNGFEDPLLIVTLGLEMGVLADVGVSQKFVPDSEGHSYYGLVMFLTSHKKQVILLLASVNRQVLLSTAVQLCSEGLPYFYF